MLSCSAGSPQKLLCALADVAGTQNLAAAVAAAGRQADSCSEQLATLHTVIDVPHRAYE